MDRKSKLQLLAENARQKNRKKGLSQAFNDDDYEEHSNQGMYDENGELLPCFGNDFIVADDEGGEEYVEENYDYQKERKKRKLNKVLEKQGVLPSEITASQADELVRDVIKQESSEFRAPKVPNSQRAETSIFFRKMNKIILPDELDVPGHQKQPPRDSLGVKQEFGLDSKPSSAFYINVFIEDAKLAIPCKGTDSSTSKVVTILDLIKETDVRFSKSHGISHFLNDSDPKEHSVEITRLETKEGSVLDPNDQIAGLLEHGQEILAITSDKELNNFGVQYKRACVKKQIVINPRIHDRLKKSTSEDTRQLDFSACRVCKDDIMAISIAMLQFTGITHLNLKRNNLDDKCVDEVNKALRSLAGLQILDLSSNEITKWNVLLETISGLQELQELDLAYNALKDYSGSALEKIIRNCNRLSSLSVAGCQFSIPGFLYLSQGLTGSALHLLNMSDNTLTSNEDTEERLISIAKAIVRSPIQKIDFTSCGIRSPEFLQVLLSNPSRLRSLALSRNPLGKECLQVIGESLPTSQIEVLDLSHVGIAVEQVELICSTLPLSKIVRLSLVGNKEVGKVLETVTRAIQQTYSIKDVDLSAVNITQEGLAQLSSNLSRPNMLQRLNISCNKLVLSDADIQRLTMLISQVPSLTKLELTGNKCANKTSYDILISSWERFHSSDEKDGLIWLQ